MFIAIVAEDLQDNRQIAEVSDGKSECEQLMAESRQYSEIGQEQCLCRDWKPSRTNVGLCMAAAL